MRSRIQGIFQDLEVEHGAVVLACDQWVLRCSTFRGQELLCDIICRRRSTRLERVHHTIPTDSVPTDAIPTVRAQSGRRVADCS